MSPVTTALAQHTLGQKQYELTNHLGNVQATVSDRLQRGYYGSTKLYFRPAMPSTYDYYPFGMLMPGRWSQDTGAKCAVVTMTGMLPPSTWVPKTWPSVTKVSVAGQDSVN